MRSMSAAEIVARRTGAFAGNPVGLLAKVSPVVPKDLSNHTPKCRLQSAGGKLRGDASLPFKSDSAGMAVVTFEPPEYAMLRPLGRVLRFVESTLGLRFEPSAAAHFERSFIT